jgi:hypothetical protein
VEKDNELEKKKRELGKIRDEVILLEHTIRLPLDIRPPFPG